MIGADRINSNARGAIVDSGSPCQPDDTVLGCAVGGHMREAGLGGLTGYIDDPPATACCFHMLGGGLGTEKYTAQGHVNDQRPFLGRNLSGVLHHKSNARIVYQHVDATKLLNHLIEKLGDRIR